MAVLLNGATKLDAVQVPDPQFPGYSRVYYLLSDLRVVYRSKRDNYEDKEYNLRGRARSLDQGKELFAKLRSEHNGVDVSVDRKAPDRGPSGLNLRELFDVAHKSGHRAALECVPTPMRVVQHADPLNDNSPIVRDYGVVSDGVCGFAWVTIRPGNSEAAQYAKKHFGALPGYHGGMEIWVSEYGQSMTKKAAYATAFAAVLRAAGIKAYGDSRLD